MIHTRTQPGPRTATHHNVGVSTRRPHPLRSSLPLAFGLLAAAAALAWGSMTVRGQPEGTATPTRGDVMQGWRVFHEKQCADCHAIWNLGGRVGPDLGRIRLGRPTDAQLAGVMWNHIPKMLGRMKQAGHRPVTLSHEEIADLFALIFFVRQLDELGDPVRGEEVLRSKGCSECHETEASAESIGPDLAKWGKYVNPIVWAQMMWEHAPLMEEAMQRAGMDWPKLEGADLVHIVAYVRSTGTSGERTYLRPGSVTGGRRSFAEKKCGNCHPGAGPDLATADLPDSVAALASRMWNHSPAMTRLMGERDVARLSVSPQELADILAFILALGNQDRGGDPARGQRVFAQKGCVQCHEGDGDSASDGPPIGQLGENATPVGMAAAMWNHGEAMLEQMTEAGISWPVFGGAEMVDLLAYLKVSEPLSPSDDAP